MLTDEILTHVFCHIRGHHRSGPYNNLDVYDFGEQDEDPSTQRALYYLSLVCREFFKLSIPVLYQYLNVDWDTGRLAAVVTTLMAHPDWAASHVRKLRVVNFVQEKGEGTRLAEKMEILLSLVENVEEIVLFGVNVLPFHPNDEEIKAQARATWTKAFLPLSKCSNLRSLWILGGKAAFELPPLLALEHFRTDHPLPSIPLSAEFPALTTLCLLNQDSTEYSELGIALEPVLPYLVHLILLLERTPPFFIANLLSLAPELRTLKVCTSISTTENESNLLSELSSIEEMPISGGIVDEIQISISLTGPRRPTEDFIEGIRKLLFDVRFSEVIKVEFFQRYRETAARKAEVLSEVQEAWRAPGTRVEIESWCFGDSREEIEEDVTMGI